MKPLLLVASLLASPAWAVDAWRFSFDGQPAKGEIAIAADTTYSRERGHGFEADDKRNAAGLPYFF